MISFQSTSQDINLIIEEIFKEIPRDKFPNCTISCHMEGNVLKANRNGDVGEIVYPDRRSLIRAITFFAEETQTCWNRVETPRYDLLCAMPDVSRNAVPKVETLKKFYRLLAIEGYNAVMLYTEDVYELPNYPYFGHLRGRYTKQELKELDDYANLLGLEMIPAIQTLAHLNGFFEWPASSPWQDCNDIMLVGEEKVYKMVEDMIVFMKDTLRSRKINIGLDEAFLLGAGKYLEKNGYKPRYQIMLDHLKRVAAICEKHGMEPRMWSDMFFRSLNGGVYRVPGTKIPQNIVEQVPSNITLVYWDYYQTNENVYNEMFQQHKAFHNPIAFAGGDSSWYGIVPLNLFSKNCVKAASKSIQKNDIKEVYVTMWGDDGGACSLFSTLSTLFQYAEDCWQCDLEKASNRLLVCTGLCEEELLDFEALYNLPSRKAYGYSRPNPGKYIFYENILTGKFDYHIPDGSEEQITKVANRLKQYAEKKGTYQYFFKAISSFANVLSMKVEMGKKIYNAYTNKDKKYLQQLADQIPELCKKIQEFRLDFRKQWMEENKNFGFDVMDIRIGGLLAQLDTNQMILTEYLQGQRANIEELEAPRLPYGFAGDKGFDNDNLFVNRWERIAAQDISNMF